jgi:hypothetical protein
MCDFSKPGNQNDVSSPGNGTMSSIDPIYFMSNGYWQGLKKNLKTVTHLGVYYLK